MIYAEMFDESEPSAPSAPAHVPSLPVFDDPLAESDGSAERYCADLLRQELLDKIAPSISPPATPIRDPISPNTYRQSPLPTVSDTNADTEAGECDCPCPGCVRGVCALCDADPRCEQCQRLREAELPPEYKTQIQAMLQRFRKSLPSYAERIPESAFHAVEDAMSKYVADVVGGDTP